MLGTGNDLRTTTAFRIWRTHFCARHLHAAHFAVGIHFNTQRLDVELELHALFTRVFHFAFRARHVLFVTTIGTDDVRCILTNGGTHAVHRGITATQHHHAFAFHADVRLIGGFAIAHNLLGVSNQERQSVVNTWRIFVFQTTAHGLIGPYAQEHGVVVLQQIVELHIAAHFHIQFELNAHAGEDFTAASHNLFFQLEGRDTEGQQTADFRVTVKDHRLHAVTGQNVCTGQTCRARTDDRHAFVGLLHAGHIRTPAHLERFIVDIALDVTDSHRAKLVVQRTGTFTQTILRTHTAAHFRQGVGLVRQLGGFKNTSFVGEFQPVRDVVVHRAFPFTVRVTAGQAAVCLCFGLAF